MMSADLPAETPPVIPAAPASPLPGYVQVGRLLQAVIVWTTYTICLGVAVWYVIQHASNVPFYDDWQFVFWMVGKQPLNLQWLFAQHNEHLIPIPRLLVVTMLALSGKSLYAATFPAVGAVALLSASLIILARHLRGYANWTDGIFAFLFLSLAHSENLITPLQVTFTGAALIPGLLLVLMLWQPEGPVSNAGILGIALCGICTLGFGPASMVYCPALILWLLYAAYRRWRSGASVKLWGSLAGVACLLIVLLALFVLTFKHPGPPPAPPNPWAVVSIAGQFLALGASPHLKDYWPESAWLVPGLLLACAGRLSHVFLTRPGERLRAAALLLCMTSLVGLAFSIGIGRAQLADVAGWTFRYGVMSALSLVMVYLTLLLYSPDQQYRLFFSGCLCLATGWAFCTSGPFGIFMANTHSAQLKEFEHDLRNGMRTAILVDNYSYPHVNRSNGMVCPDPFWFSGLTLDLRRNHIGPFQPTPADGNTYWEALPVAQVRTENLQWDPATLTGKVLRPPARIFIDLPRPDHVQRLYLNAKGVSATGQPVTLRITETSAQPMTNGFTTTVPIKEIPFFKVRVEKFVSGFQLTFEGDLREVQLLQAAILGGNPVPP